MTVSDNTVQAEYLSDFSESLGEKDLMYQKTLQET